MKQEKKVILSFTASLWVAMPLYLILHEGGHAMIAKLFGAEIIEFNIMQAYVVVEGGILTHWSLALFYLAGLMLPTIIWILCAIFYRQHVNSMFYKSFMALFTGFVMFSIGVWIVVPIMYSMGQAKPYDDVVQFIKASGVPAMIVALLSGIIFGLGIVLVRRKRIFRNFMDAVKRSEQE